ncbi:MAG: hypothetical protein SFW67_07585 [Myxococcaceae bacterium]|nr:hypothetical protein [Myxococcaceae bacterium]
MVLLRVVFLAGSLGLVSGCGTWVCDRNSCPTGCCDSVGTCVLNGGSGACGTLGAACSSCAGGQCNAGVCTCPAGLELSAGRCLCTANSCNGCCDNVNIPSVCRGTANNPVSSQFCGARGAACVACSAGSSCISGQCCITRGSRCSNIAGSAPCCSQTNCAFSTSAGEFRCQ